MKSTEYKMIHTSLGSSPPSNVQNDPSTASSQLSNPAPTSLGLTLAIHTHRGFQGPNLRQDLRFGEELQAWDPLTSSHIRGRDHSPGCIQQSDAAAGQLLNSKIGEL